MVARGGGAGRGRCYAGGAPEGARGCSSMAELLLPKQIARVRFPSAPPHGSAAAHPADLSSRFRTASSSLVMSRPAVSGSHFHRKGSAITASSTMRSEEHTSELQSLMRISYAVFCLKQKKK